MYRPIPAVVQSDTYVATTIYEIAVSKSRWRYG